MKLSRKVIKWWTFELRKEGKNMWFAPTQEIPEVGRVHVNVGYREDGFHAWVTVNGVCKHGEGLKPEDALYEAYTEASLSARAQEKP